MKRFTLFMAMLFAIMAAGCTGTTGEKPTDTGTAQTTPPAGTIRGVVYDVYEGGIGITNSEYGGGIRMIHASTKNAKADAGHNTIGAVVEITAGEILDIYPEQCDAQFVKLIESAEQSGGGMGMAYFRIFEDLFSMDTALQEGTYLALDMEGVKAGEAAQQVMAARMQQFCMDNGYSLLQMNMKELEDEGYIKDLVFEEGFLIGFEDDRIDAGKLVTNAQKWKSGLGAVGAKYTAELIDDEWALELSDEWISKLRREL